MCAGLQATIERERWSAKSVLVWVDYSSIPQANKTLQSLLKGDSDAKIRAAPADYDTLNTVWRWSAHALGAEAMSHELRGLRGAGPRARVEVLGAGPGFRPGARF